MLFLLNVNIKNETKAIVSVALEIRLIRQNHT